MGTCAGAPRLSESSGSSSPQMAVRMQRQPRHARGPVDVATAAPTYSGGRAFLPRRPILGVPQTLDRAGGEISANARCKAVLDATPCLIYVTG